MKASFDITKLSPKQEDVMTWWVNPEYKEKDGIICDGAIRSGKTYPMSLSFVIWAMGTFDGENLALCGKTIQSLRRNVIKKLKILLSSYGYIVEEHRSENYMTIRKNGMENDFYLFGGKDEASQDLIQGITLAGVFFDEVALMPESFVNQATGRCSVAGSKFWFNCNPEGPEHWFKKEWIDRIKEKNLIRIHFTMDDNPSLTEKILARYKSMYKGVFYERFILGLWVLASGIIFKYFAEDAEPYLFEDTELFDSDGKLKQAFSKIIMGIDFGGTGSKTTFVVNGYLNNYKDFRIIDSDGLPITENIDSEAICQKFIEVYKRVSAKYGRIDWVFPDSASPTMINSLRAAAIKAGLPYSHIKGCRKNEVKDRPKLIDLLLNTGRLKIGRHNRELIDAIKALRWDEKKPDIPEDKNIDNCNDWYDALCYTMLDFIEFINLGR